MKQASIFEGGRRLQMTESIELTIQSLQAHGYDHDNWGIAWSGGKDSSATLSLICWLLDSGKLKRPKSLTVFYADTRMELPPLAIAALQMMDDLRECGIEIHVVRAPMDKRFFVYMLGRGVPPPNNNTLRWCTRQIKVDPMTAAIAKNPQRMGPLTFEARLMGLERILSIQAEVNARGLAIDILDAEEEARIRELIDLETWPDGWDGDEPTGDTIMPIVYQNGAMQPLLFGAEA